MDKNLINPTTLRQLEGFINHPSHALLLEGVRGAGKGYLAQWLSASLLKKTITELNSYPYYLHVAVPEDKQAISIDAVREVNKFIELKVPAGQKRLVVIEDAQLMTPEAQNALLKSLEEPPAGTIFILTSGPELSLLPTIASRATKVTTKPVSLGAALTFFGAKDGAQVESSWQLSGGAVGLLWSLLSNEDSELKLAVEQAKSLLAHDRYERLLELDSLSRDKRQFALFLEGLIKVIQALYKNAAKQDKPSKNLLSAVKVVLDAQVTLSQNGLPRLIAINLALNLPI